MAARLLLACVVTLTGCMGTDAAAPDEPPLLETGAAGVTIALPEGWRPLAIDDGNIVEPSTRVAVASGPRRLQVAGCDTQITRYAPKPDGAALVVVEWQPAEDVNPPPRPRRLDGTLRLRRGELECFAGDGGTTQFVEHGRVIGVYAMVGTRADARLADELRRAAATLRVEPRG